MADVCVGATGISKMSREAARGYGVHYIAASRLASLATYIYLDGGSSTSRPDAD